MTAHGRAPRRSSTKYWGYTEFRPLQREAMESVLAHRDSIVVMPTGGGKSLCFQAPALVHDGMAVVVSPLDLADEGPGGHAGRQRRARRAVQQLARPTRRAAVVAGIREGRVPAAVRVARSGWSGDGGDSVPVAAGAGARQFRRRRRGALHQPVGARLPAGIPSARAAARSCSPASAFTPTPRRRRRACGATSPRSSALQRAARVRRLVRSAQPRLPGAAARRRSRSSCSTSSPGIAARPASSTARRGARSTRWRHG